MPKKQQLVSAAPLDATRQGGNVRVAPSLTGSNADPATPSTAAAHLGTAAPGHIPGFGRPSDPSPWRKTPARGPRARQCCTAN